MNIIKYKLALLSLIGFLLAGNIAVQGQTLELGEELMNEFIRDTVFQVSENVKETHMHYLNTAGDTMAVYVLKAKLKPNELELQAANPFDKDTFAMQTVKKQVKWKNKPHNKVVGGINADFFNMKTGVPNEMTIINGDILRDTISAGKNFVGVQKSGKIIIGDSVLYEKEKGNLREALGARPLLVKNGDIIPQKDNKFSETRHPRTALGTNGHTVFFIVVDGRQPNHSNGMPLTELALLMKSVGAKNAVNLDGGGSSTLVSFDKIKNKWTTRNHPSGGQLRPVANIWAIVKKGKPTPKKKE